MTVTSSLMNALLMSSTIVVAIMVVLMLLATTLVTVAKTMPAALVSVLAETIHRFHQGFSSNVVEERECRSEC